tara:strand:+ start:9082 stop:9603 length:522 start_codon:yes stop_codon:yes gene_type:complete
MDNILIIYSTVDGHTKSICERIKSTVGNAASVKLIPLESTNKEVIEQADTIVIGASIRYGKHRPFLFSFINKHMNILKTKKSAFFSVNIVARKEHKNTHETNPYIIKFLNLTEWRPDMLDVFAGRLDFPKYGFLDKYIIKFIMWITNGPTDTTKSYEFTAWDRVDAFAKKLVA